MPWRKRRHAKELITDAQRSLDDARTALDDESQDEQTAAQREHERRMKVLEVQLDAIRTRGKPA